MMRRVEKPMHRVGFGGLVDRYPSMTTPVAASGTNSPPSVRWDCRPLYRRRSWYRTLRLDHSQKKAQGEVGQYGIEILFGW